MQKWRNGLQFSSFLSTHYDLLLLFFFHTRGSFHDTEQPTLIRNKMGWGRKIRWRYSNLHGRKYQMDYFMNT